MKATVAGRVLNYLISKRCFYSLLFIHLFVFSVSVKPAGGESRQKIFSRIECFFFKKEKTKQKKGFDFWSLNQTWNFSVFGYSIRFLMSWLHSLFLSSFQISFFIHNRSNRSLLLEQITKISWQGFSVFLKDTSSRAEPEHEPSRWMKGHEHDQQQQQKKKLRYLLSE